MKVVDLGLMPYRQAWEIQQSVHDEVVVGGESRLLVAEHPPVITVGRRPDPLKNLITPESKLRELGIEFVESDRGGDITYHAPGQIVAYPIVRLMDYRLSVGAYMHRLEAIAIAALNEIGIKGQTDRQAVGVWVEDGGVLAKICALGVRIRRGVSMHGLALNVNIDLSGFSHIVPCGLASRPVTSIAKLLGNRAPSVDRVKEILNAYIKASFKPAVSQ